MVYRLSLRRFLPAISIAIGAAVSAAVTPPCRAGDWQRRCTIRLDRATTRPNSVAGITLSNQTLAAPYRDINPDGSDVRFTTADGAISLNYWIESWNPAGESKLWVRVPTAQTAAIAMKYGNPAAKPASSGSAVFDFFDDFNNGIWTKYVANPVISGFYGGDPYLTRIHGAFYAWHSQAYQC